jgi:hypothetical protein
MKTFPALAVLNTIFFDYVFASNPPSPIHCCGFQGVYLGVTSQEDPDFNNKSITLMNNRLDVIAMGNIGVSPNPPLAWGPAEVGWNAATGVLAARRTVPNMDLNWFTRDYDWVPLAIHTAVMPITGLANPWFPVAGAMGSSVNVNFLHASPEGTIGALDSNGDFLSRWYICHKNNGSGTLSWSFDEDRPSNPTCVAVELFMVNHPGSVSHIKQPDVNALTSD